MTARARWIRHRKLVIGLAGAILALIVLFGSDRVSALSSSERSNHAAPEEGLDIAGTVDLFDDRVVHELEVEYRPADYTRMMRAFRRSGSKDYIKATLRIDGTRIEQVGLRLKGNSTLRGLERGDVGDFGPGGSVSADEPERLPWLVSFDEFVDGRSYQGHDTLAIRAGLQGARGGGETGLNEALALRLIERAGQPAEASAFAVLAVNERKPVLRLLVEDPDKLFAHDNFEDDGVLYKALSTGSFDYRGEDPLAYGDSFRQVTGKKQQDLQPLIDLLRWTAKASDVQFAAGVDRRIDVNAFAAYVALQELIDNFDDMAGPGQNYYLWYDLKTEKFTPVTWDLNLAFSGFGRGRAAPGGRFGGGGGGFGPRGGNALKERFLAVPRYERLVNATQAKLQRRLYDSSSALRELEQLRDVAASSGVTASATLAAEFDDLRSRIEQRGESG